MEGHFAMKKLPVVEERPCDNNTDAPYRTEKPSIHNTLGSTLLSLRLNNSEMAPQREGQPPTQMGLLRIKLEEAKKENRNLRAMVNQINECYTALQSRLLLAMQQHQLSTSPRNNHELQGNTQDAGKPVLSTRQFLNIGGPSPPDGSTKEGFDSAENFKEIGKNLAYMHNSEDEINIQVTSEEAKRKDDQAIEVCRKAKVSIRARSDFSLMGDGCQWRKYGQKIAKGNPCPRAYYRCSMGTLCPVRKQIQKCFKDETVIITTYEGKHNHPLPPAARPLASSTSAALNMFLSGSMTSSHGTTLANSLHFPSLSSSPFTATATFSPSVSCPTVTLDLTHQTNNSLQFQRVNPLDHNQSFTFPIVPLHGHSTKRLEGLYLPSKVPTMIAPVEKSLTLVDVVSKAITTDPSLKATLFAAISSLNGVPQDINNSHNQSSESGHDPYSKIPTMAPKQP